MKMELLINLLLIFSSKLATAKIGLLADFSSRFHSLLSYFRTFVQCTTDYTYTYCTHKRTEVQQQ